MKTIAADLAKMLAVFALCIGMAFAGVAVGAGLAQATPQAGGYGSDSGK